jgi:hypothetical protein
MQRNKQMRIETGKVHSEEQIYSKCLMQIAYLEEQIVTEYPNSVNNADRADIADHVAPTVSGVLSSHILHVLIRIPSYQQIS